LRYIARIALPRVARKVEVGVAWQVNTNARLTNVLEATLALPAIARGSQKGVLGNDYGHAQSTAWSVAPLALPAGSIELMRRIGVLRYTHRNAAVLTLAKVAVARPIVGRFVKMGVWREDQRDTRCVVLLEVASIALPLVSRRREVSMVRNVDGEAPSIPRVIAALALPASSEGLIGTIGVRRHGHRAAAIDGILVTRITFPPFPVREVGKVRMGRHTNRGATLALPVETALALPLVAPRRAKGMLGYVAYHASADGLSISSLAHAADIDFAFIEKGRYARWLGAHDARRSDSYHCECDRES
jgi:hypothetical protein